MAIHQLPPTTQSFRLDDHLENMAIPPLLRPQDDFRIGYQLPDIAVPPPSPPSHFFRFGHHDHLANVAIPQPNFIEHGIQLVNGDLKAEEDPGRDEQVSEDGYTIGIHVAFRYN